MKSLRKAYRGQKGFTLVELLVVVVILGVLAGVVIPSFTGTTEDARGAQLGANLVLLRDAIELYYHQHNGTYPGAHSHLNGNPVENPVQAANAFLEQLTTFSDVDGKTSETKDSTFLFGPYIKTGIPKNPFNDENGVTCDIVETDITAVASNTDDGTGWKNYVLIGRLIANDGAHDSY